LTLIFRTILEYLSAFSIFHSTVQAFAMFLRKTGGS
jgi:hypothetical protein